MKFCRKCGYLARADNLRDEHFPSCQPELKKWENGFLMNELLPERNAEDFKLMMRLIGASSAPTGGPMQVNDPLAKSLSFAESVIKDRKMEKAK